MSRRALASLLVGLQLGLGTARPEPEPVERYCEGHELQERFLADASRVRVLICGRRTGKTVVLRVEAVRAALAMHSEPDVYVVYITNTLKNGKRQFWRPLKRMLRDLGYSFTSNESDMVLELTNGGCIRMASASDKKAVEDIRGDGSPLVIIDECGTYPSDLLLSLVTEVVEPMTLDVGGRIIFAGTPGPTLSGYWYEKSGPSANGAVYRGDLRSNPHLMRSVPAGPEREAAIEAFLASVREDNGWGEDHPTYVREWLGRWAQDDQALVFPLSAANDCAANDAGPWGLPRTTPTGYPLPWADWRVVIGMDVGMTQANAYVVAATHPQLRGIWVLHVSKFTGQLIPQAEKHLRALQQRYAVRWAGSERLPVIVIDSGGMGKVHAETMRRAMGLPNEAADKRDKPSSISMTRDALLARPTPRIHLVRRDEDGEDPCRLLANEWHVLVWNKKRDGIEDGQEDHATDAGLYAFRRLRDYTRHEPDPKPEPGTPEWHAQEEREMEKAALRRHQNLQRAAARNRRRAGKVA